MGALAGGDNNLKQLSDSGGIIAINPATEDKQDDIITELKLKADLAETQPVSNASLPLPAGASTEDKQDDIITAIGKGLSIDLQGNGKTAVGTTAVEIAFTGVTESIIISADIDNAGTLYIGKSNVTTAGANAIAFLEAGETITMDYDDTTNSLYVIASQVTQNFWAGCLK